VGLLVIDALEVDRDVEVALDVGAAVDAALDEAVAVLVGVGAA